jgi:hypothetical protein
MNGRSLLAGVLGSSLASVAFAQTPAPTTAPPIVTPSAAPAAPAAPAGSAAVAVGVDSGEGMPVGEPQSLAGRFEGGLRTGLGIALGKAGDNTAGQSRDVSDIVGWRVPIWIDIGYRVSDPLSLGVYAQLGLGGGGDCDGSCNSSDLRLGAQALWHAASGGLWLGVGLGYEWQSLYALRVPPEVPIDTNIDAVSQLASRVAETLGGPEITLQAGLDFELEPGLAAGPYVAASAGQYLTDSFDCDQVDCPGGSSINGSATHAWLGLGLRGSYAP